MIKREASIVNIGTDGILCCLGFSYQSFVIVLQETTAREVVNRAVDAFGIQELPG